MVHRYGVNGKKVQIIAEGVDLKVFKRRSTKEIDRVRKRYKLPQNYILFVGTIQPRKNLKMAIEAFSDAYNRIQKNSESTSGDSGSANTYFRGKADNERFFLSASKLGRKVEGFAPSKVYGSKSPEKAVSASKSNSGNSLQKDAFDCQFVLAGRLGWDYREILEAPKKLSVERRVKFLKYVDSADLPALYSGARLLLC